MTRNGEVSAPDMRWQVSTDGGVEPRWHPNGRELLFRDGQRMYAVPVTTSPGFVKGRPELLFEQPFQLSSVGSQNYDVSQDGRFLMIESPLPARDTTALSVVTAWFSEIGTTPRP